MVSLPEEFRPSLDSYSGPLDLLFYLIKKDEVDIFDIPIARLVGQYQIYLEILKEIDPNTCGDFLVMAARLMEIKSKLLLPREILDGDEEEIEDPRIELVRQLLEYKKFKERALLLERRLSLHRKRYNRPRLDLHSDKNEEEPLDLGSVGIWDLLTAFHRIQIALGVRMPHQIVLEDRPQEDFMRDVEGRLGSIETRTVEFDDLFSGLRTRNEAVGYFLAILELAKEYRIMIYQESGDERIYVTLRSPEEAQRLRELELADEITAEEEAELAAAAEMSLSLEEEGELGFERDLTTSAIEELSRFPGQGMAEPADPDLGASEESPAAIEGEPGDGASSKDSDDTGAGSPPEEGS